jgi:hypothetical protein
MLDEVDSRLKYKAECKADCRVLEYKSALKRKRQRGSLRMDLNFSEYV